MSETYYTPSQAGDLIGVHQNTILRWIKQGKLRASKTLGGHRRIWHTDLISFLEENEMGIPLTLMRGSDDEAYSSE